MSSPIASHREALVALMLETADPATGTRADDLRQFVVGFVSVMEAASAGDLGPRDEYLMTVIPALRRGGMKLSTVLESMVRVSMAASAVLPREHLLWLSDFCALYTRELLRIWEGPSS